MTCPFCSITLPRFAEELIDAKSPPYKVYMSRKTVIPTLSWLARIPHPIPHWHGASFHLTFALTDQEFDDSFEDIS